MGLHRESSWKPSSPIVRETRRRTWWALYVFDRYDSSKSDYIISISHLYTADLPQLFLDGLVQSMTLIVMLLWCKTWMILQLDILGYIHRRLWMMEPWFQLLSSPTSDLSSGFTVSLPQLLGTFTFSAVLPKLKLSKGSATSTKS